MPSWLIYANGKFCWKKVDYVDGIYLRNLPVPLWVAVVAFFVGVWVG